MGDSPAVFPAPFRSRLLYLTAELYEHGLITEKHKHLLKHRILENDTNLMSAAEVIVDSNVLKQ